MAEKWSWPAYKRENCPKCGAALAGRAFRILGHIPDGVACKNNQIASLNAENERLEQQWNRLGFDFPDQMYEPCFGMAVRRDETLREAIGRWYTEFDDARADARREGLEDAIRDTEAEMKKWDANQLPAGSSPDKTSRAFQYHLTLTKMRNRLRRLIDQPRGRP